MEGFLVIDKPLGATSFDVVRQVRRLLKVRRVGHCGTLDPLATGVLPVAIGEATRLVEFVMDGEKVYRATLKLGETTDTQDAEGTILEQHSIAGVDAAAVHAAAATFLGRIEQLPPMYSALKRNGVPLYELARKGIEVERATRAIEIRRLEILAIELPLVTFEVTCSKGTYVRTLGHDLGQRLGCGAHLIALRRTQSGAFREADAVPLAALMDDPDGAAARLLPTAAAMAAYPGREVTDEAALTRLRNGVPPTIAEVEAQPELAPGTILTLRSSGRLLAVARFAPERDEELRGDFILLRVFPANV